MKTWTRILLTLLLVSTLVVSCSPAATEQPVTEQPVTEQPATEQPATEQPVTEQPPNTLMSDVVVILVVDAFTAVETTPEPKSSENCSVTADGQKATGHESATITLDQPHGRFVYTDLIHQLELSSDLIEGGLIRSSTSGDDFSGTNMQFSVGQIAPISYPWIMRYDLFESKSKGSGLLVVAVDTNGLDLETIQNNMKSAFDDFSQKEVLLGTTRLPSATKFVVNMSFVLIPCDVSEVLGENIEEIHNDYLNHGSTYDEANKIDALADLRTRLTNLYHGDVEKLNSALEGLNVDPPAVLLLSDEDKEKLIEEAVFQAYIVDRVYSLSDHSWIDQNGPQDSSGQNLFEFLKSYSENPNLQVINVGAAGNFEINYPFAPASWDFVDSVSSESSVQLTHPKTQSLANGLSLANYSNWAEIQDDGDHFSVPELIYGTSFAAPKLSAKIAMYLLDGGITPCSNSSPALGYAKGKDPIFTDVSDTQIVNVNLTYDDAMTTCP